MTPVLESLFHWVFSVSAKASILVLLIVLAKSLLRNKLERDE